MSPSLLGGKKWPPGTNVSWSTTREVKDLDSRKSYRFALWLHLSSGLVDWLFTVVQRPASDTWGASHLSVQWHASGPGSPNFKRQKVCNKKKTAGLVKLSHKNKTTPSHLAVNPIWGNLLTNQAKHLELLPRVTLVPKSCAHPKWAKSEKTFTPIYENKHSNSELRKTQPKS